MRPGRGRPAPRRAGVVMSLGVLLGLVGSGPASAPPATAAEPTVRVALFALSPPRGLRVTALAPLRLTDGRTARAGETWGLGAPGERAALAGEGAIRVEAPGGQRRRLAGRWRFVAGPAGEVSGWIELPLERYVAGVLAAELPGAPLSAQGALALAVRGQIEAAHRRPRHARAMLCDGPHCMAFKGEAPITETAREAARLTRAQAAHDGATGAPIAFHAACGGDTALPAAGFGRVPAGPAARVPLSWRAVSDRAATGEPYCRAPAWQGSEGLPAFERRLVSTGLWPAGARLVSVSTPRERVVSLAGSGVRRLYASADLFVALGPGMPWASWRSPALSFRTAAGRVRWTGRGLGHGVGICQRGLAARARAHPELDSWALLRAYVPSAIGFGGTPLAGP